MIWHWWNDERVAWLLWPGLFALALAFIARFGDHRRRRRAEPDAVGFVPWATLHVLALLGAVILLGLAARIWIGS